MTRSPHPPTGRQCSWTTYDNLLIHHVRPPTDPRPTARSSALAHEWTYAHSYTNQPQRETAYRTRPHHYNHHRPRTALGDHPTNRIHNLAGKYD